MNFPNRLFTFLLPRKEVCEESSLYYHDEKQSSVLLEDRLHIPAGETLFLDGYFNLFDYAPYRDDTSISEVAYRVTVQGTGKLRLSLLGSTDNSQEEIALREIDFCSSEKQEVSLSLSLSDLKGRGSIFLSLSAEKDSAFFGGYAEAEGEPLRAVKIGIAITTFRREEYVKRNVALIGRDLPKEQFGVFVVDNGNTLSPSDVPNAHLFPNKNLGGSGGFTRGIMEITKRGEFTHILLTDDDISFDPEIFRRTAAILSYTLHPDEIIIGASMLFSDKPWCQMEMGAEWTGRKLLPHNKRTDLRLRDTLLQNAAQPIADYTGWWYNCFSTAIPKRIGLPFPFFIKIDDVEYCIRAKCKILLLNGIGVWHEDFDYKFNSALDYYHERNKLILNALHYKRRGAVYHFFNLMRAAIKQVVLYRYHSLDLVFKAYRDFLSGADAYLSTDAVALHKSLATLGEKQYSEEELKAQGYDLSRPIIREKRFKRPGLIRLVTMNGYLLPAKREDYRIVDLTRGNPNDFYKAKRVLQYNPISKTGFFTKRKLSVLVKTGFRLCGWLFILLFRYRKAARSFRKAFPELISEQSWKERMDLK